jgi:transcriptional regulator with XRE-family HTH domain
VDDDIGEPRATGGRAARYVVRVRRLADLSQRDLAARICVSSSTVGRYETGAACPSIEVFEQILALAGLRLLVVDERGDEVLPVSDDLVRDNQGRRFPAHLDVNPPDETPFERLAYPRYDRLPARGWFRHRTIRDRRAEDHPYRQRPADHPTDAELRTRVRLMRGRQPVVEAPPRPEPECLCPDACFEGLCIVECPCQCEPERNRLGILRHRPPVPEDDPSTDGQAS